MIYLQPNPFMSIKNSVLDKDKDSLAKKFLNGRLVTLCVDDLYKWSLLLADWVIYFFLIEWLNFNFDKGLRPKFRHQQKRTLMAAVIFLMKLENSCMIFCVLHLVSLFFQNNRLEKKIFIHEATFWEKVNNAWYLLYLAWSQRHLILFFLPSNIF